MVPPRVAHGAAPMGAERRSTSRGQGAQMA